MVDGDDEQIWQALENAQLKSEKAEAERQLLEERVDRLEAENKRLKIANKRFIDGIRQMVDLDDTDEER